MSFTIRPTTAADRPAIVSLLDGAGLHSRSSERDLEWKYWQPREDWPQARSFVLAKDAEIFAHAGVIPSTCVWNGHRASMLHLIDWAAAPGRVGAGVTLLKHISWLADALIGVGGNEHTLRSLPAIGFRISSTETEYVRVLYPLRYLTNSPQWGWKTLPKLARSILWTMTSPSRKAADWSWRRLASSQLQSLDGVLPRARGGVAVLERSSKLFAYILKCPIASMALHRLEKAGKARGYFLLAFVPGQARLADCWVDSDDAADWRALVRCAVQAARQDPGVAELTAVANDPLLSDALVKAGFRSRDTNPIQVLVRKGQDLPPTFRVQMLDSDAAYRHRGYARYLA